MQNLLGGCNLSGVGNYSPSQRRPGFSWGLTWSSAQELVRMVSFSLRYSMSIENLVLQTNTFSPANRSCHPAVGMYLARHGSYSQGRNLHHSAVVFHVGGRWEFAVLVYGDWACALTQNVNYPVFAIYIFCTVPSEGNPSPVLLLFVTLSSCPADMAGYLEMLCICSSSWSEKTSDQWPVCSQGPVPYMVALRSQGQLM